MKILPLYTLTLWPRWYNDESFVASGFGCKSGCNHAQSKLVLSTVFLVETSNTSIDVCVTNKICC